MERDEGGVEIGHKLSVAGNQLSIINGQLLIVKDYQEKIDRATGRLEQVKGY